MKVELIPIEKIKPYPKNNRVHPQEQIDHIAKSISAFGFNQPIVIDENHEILVGHGRWMAAKQLEMEDVPCVQLKNLSKSQKRAYRILDNKLQNDSDWQIDNLKIELTDLALDGFDLTFGGLEELSHLFPEEEPDVLEDEFDGEEPGSTFIKLGDIIELGNHRVMCGDSTDSGDFFDWPKTRLLLSDPPYGLSEKWSGLQEFRSNERIQNDDSIDHIIEIIKTAEKQVIEPFSAYIWAGGKMFHKLRSEIEKIETFKMRAHLVWAKEHFNVGRADYHSQTEHCLYFSTDKRTWNGERDQSDLWQANRKEQERVHPTQKPLSLMGKSIVNSSNANDIIADPFLGSGTTLIAADQLNRICYGMEISPKYCHVIVQRYLKHCRKSQKQFDCKINGEKMLAKHFES